MNKDEIKESLSIEQIDTLLMDFGSATPRISGSTHIYQTVCHCGDSHKLYYSQERLAFHCFTGSCGTFDVYELVGMVQERSGNAMRFPQRVQFIADKFGFDYYTDDFKIGFGNPEDEEVDEWLSKFFEKPKEKVSILKEYDPTILGSLADIRHESFIREGISEETLIKYNIQYDWSDHRITIPHWDINNRLVGIRGRATVQTKYQDHAKYMPIYKNGEVLKHDTGKNLYGLNFTKEAIKETKKVVIWEGEKSVLKCDTIYGERNFSVATCGKVISDYQRDLLLDLGINEVIIAYDKQYQENYGLWSSEMTEYAEYLKRIAHKFIPYVSVKILWDKKNYLNYKDAPIDRGQAILEMLMKEKIELTDSAYH